jgi:hypothetical protein
LVPRWIGHPNRELAQVAIPAGFWNGCWGRGGNPGRREVIEGIDPELGEEKEGSTSLAITGQAVAQFRWRKSRWTRDRG